MACFDRLALFLARVGYGANWVVPGARAERRLSDSKSGRWRRMGTFEAGSKVASNWLPRLPFADCNDVPAGEFLLAMVKAAPAALAAELRERAGLRPEPNSAARALAASYERYADELAAIEAIRGRQRSA